LSNFFQGARLLGQGMLLFYLATRTASGAQEAGLNPAWNRFLMESQYDSTARELLSRYGVGDFNQPAQIQPLSALPGPWWRQLATPFGRVERSADGQPVVFVPTALLQPQSMFRGYLLRLLLEFQLRRFNAQSREEAASQAAAPAWGWFNQIRHRVWMFFAPTGYLAAQLGNDESLLAKQLQAGGPLAGAYRAWTRFPTEKNSRLLLAAMANVASAQGNREARAASTRTLVTLLASMPAWTGTRVGSWQPSTEKAGEDILFPIWLLDSGSRVLPGKILDLIESLPVTLDNQKLAPLRRPEVNFEQNV
jgi:hypothetical protein